MAENSSDTSCHAGETQQFLTFKREHVKQAQQAKTQPEEQTEEEVMAPTVTRGRTMAGPHGLRPTVKTIAPEEFSSDEMGQEGSDEDFRNNRNNKRKRSSKAA